MVQHSAAVIVWICSVAKARLVGCFCAFCVSLLWLTPAWTATAPVLVDPTAQIWYADSQARARLRLKVAGLNDAELKQGDLLKPIKDIGSPDPGLVIETITPIEIQSDDKAARTWIIDFTIKGAPVSVNEPRYLQVTVGNDMTTLAYFLRSLPSDKFTWSVKGPSTLKLGSKAGIPVSVSMNSVPATGLVVFHPDLTDKATHEPISDKPLYLCRASESDCKKREPLKLNPYEPAELLIWGTEHPGRFTGTVVLATPEKPEGEILSMTILVSSIGYELLGVMVILLGVGTAWFVTVFIKGRTDRAQLLLPVASLMANLNILQGSVATNPTDVATPNVTARISEVLAALAVDQLEEKGLPGSVPMPWNLTTSQTQDTYRSYVQLQSDWTTDLQLVIQRGLLPIWAKWTSGLTDDQRTAIRTATASVDNSMLAAQTAPPMATVSAQLQTVLNTLSVALAPPPVGNVPAPLAFGPQAALGIPTVQELRVEISRLNMWTWFFFCVVTTLVGSYVLIFSEAASGFGTHLDYLVCLIWGFGLSTGPQLLQSTSGSIGSSFGITK